MEQDRIYEMLSSIFQDVFDNEHLVLRPETVSADVDGWDSVSHINLIVAIEDAFHIKFSTKELESMFDVGHLVKNIEEKSAAD